MEGIIVDMDSESDWESYTTIVMLEYFCFYAPNDHIDLGNLI